MNKQDNKSHLCQTVIEKMPRILIVDDEQYVREFLKDALDTYPYDIELAVDSIEAINILNEKDFDLVLSDINLPGMSGLELLSFCKITYTSTEVILITGNPELDGAITAIRNGAFDYLTKPITPSKLYERVESALESGRKKRRTFSIPTTEVYNKDYQIKKIVGSGNAGTVFLVEKDNKQYAMKVLKKDSNTPRYQTKIERFMREAEILSRIEHPNIVKIVDFGTSDPDGSPYIVMELLSGKSLNQLIKENKFSISEKIEIIRQLAEALKIVHDLGILHRDVKPANIIITEDGVVKLLDFGIASLKDSNLTITHEILGSPAYMAPEAFDGLKKKNKPSDIFSLGVIAYELFTGRRPFQASSITELIKKIEEKEPIDPKEIAPNIPLPIQKMIQKMLRKKPEDRFTNTEIIIRTLEAVVGNNQ